MPQKPNIVVFSIRFKYKLIYPEIKLFFPLTVIFNNYLEP